MPKRGLGLDVEHEIPARLRDHRVAIQEPVPIRRDAAMVGLDRVRSDHHVVDAISADRLRGARPERQDLLHVRLPGLVGDALTHSWPQ